MAHDASQLLGARQIAGAVVNRRGNAWQHGVHHHGLVGAVAGVAMGYAADRHFSRYTTQTPEFSRTAFLAVTDWEIALIKYGPGSRYGQPADVLARVPRFEVASATVSPGLLRTNLTISFIDGGSWAFDVSPLIRRTVVRVAGALGY